MFNAALLVAAMASGNAYDPIFHGTFDNPSDCPVGRQLVAEISYGPGGTGDVDVTEWANIWGRAALLDPPVPWPGLGVAPTFVNFDPTTYVAAHFTVPEGTPDNWMGWLGHTDYNYGRDLRAAISMSCGDFNPPTPSCAEIAYSGMPIVPWRTNASPSFCPLPPGEYYLNIEAAYADGSCVPGPTTCDVQLVNEVSGR
jgi:hypothetical protein